MRLCMVPRAEMHDDLFHVGRKRNDTQNGVASFHSLYSEYTRLHPTTKHI